MSKTVIINRILTDSEISEVARLASNGFEVYTFQGTHSVDFAQQISLSKDEKRLINYKTMGEVLRFGDLPVGNQTIADIFRIDTASIWHYHKFRVYFAVRNLMYFLKPIQQKFSTFDDHIWFVPSEVKPLRNIFPQVEMRFALQKIKAKFNFGAILDYLILVKWRFLNYLFSGKKKPEYLLYLTEKYSMVLDKTTMKTRPGHHILEYLISELDGRFALLTEVLVPKPKGKSDYSFSWKQFETSWDGRSKIFLEGILISGLLKSTVRKSATKARKTIQSGYPLVRQVELSTTQKLTLEVFESLDKSSGFFLYRYFASRNYFEKSGIRAIIAGDDNSPLTKSIMDAAKICGIKVVGLQHGTMHELHPAYLYTPNDCKNHIMPDLTLTWGKYWEEFLIEKGNYPKESVVSVGQIRSDIIPLLMQTEKQEKAKSIEIILFASQPQRDPELRYQAAFDVFKAAEEFPESKLIVKLHPREFNDLDYYKAIANEAGCTNYVLDMTSDLYQLIASCDVLITCFSTVGTETVYFYKPLIILDHLNQDIMGYAAEGIAFQVSDAENLNRVLSGIFQGTLKIDRDKYDTFIQKYAFRIDGKVAERCIKAITSAK